MSVLRKARAIIIKCPC